MFKRAEQSQSDSELSQHEAIADRINEPLAYQTAWTPLKSGGANFKTYQLQPVNSDRVMFKVTLFARFFYLVFIVAGTAVLFIFPGSAETLAFNEETIVPILVGVVFVTVGSWMYFKFTPPITFDKQLNAVWKGNKAPRKTINAHQPEFYARLSDIHAIQLISEYVKSDKTSYYSYEINLIMIDGERMHVIDHGKLEAIQRDANTLAQFLDKPVWKGFD